MFHLKGSLTRDPFKEQVFILQMCFFCNLQKNLFYKLQKTHLQYKVIDFGKIMDVSYLTQTLS